MKLTNSTIANSIVTLNKLNSMPLPIKVAFKLRKNIKTLKGKAAFIEEQRIALIKQYGTEKDGKIKVSEENNEKFYREYEDLMAIEDEVSIMPLKLDEFENVKLSSKDLDSIAFMISE